MLYTTPGWKRSTTFWSRLSLRLYWLVTGGV
jgi:hypothetical protein